MKIKEDINSRKREFISLCQKHKVKTLFAFGSSVTDHFNDECSDIDLLVEVDEPDPVERGEKLMSFWDSMEIFFGRKVDLLTDSSITNPILRKSIDRTKVLVYERKEQKVFS